MDILEIFAAKKARTRTVLILLDDDLAVERERLVIEASLAERQDTWMNRRPEAPVLKERIRALDDEIEVAKVPFVFQAIPRTEWVALAEKWSDDKDELILEGFGPALIAACAIEPEMTPEQAQTMWESWSAAETEQLYLAAYRVNREVRDIPFTSVGTEPTENSEPNSTTASQEE